MLLGFGYLHNFFMFYFKKQTIRPDQVNLLVYGPDLLYFKQKRKNNITKFWPTGLFNLLFSAF